MSTLLSTALMGFFVWSGVSGEKLAAEQLAAEALLEPELPTYQVLMTGYNAVPEQTNSDPMTTASGARSNPAVIAARSRDLADTLPYGTVIEVVTQTSSSPNCGYSVVKEHIGLRVLADTMHIRKKNQIDIMLPTEQTVRALGRWVNPAVALGMCHNTEIRVVGFVDIKRIPKTQEELKLAIGGIERAEEQRLTLQGR